MLMGTELVEQAALFAIKAHAGMTRKNGRPYILHPMEVAAIVGSVTEDCEVIAAGLLHDVVEDTPHTSEEIRELFGDRVATLVASETEDKRADLPPEETWKIRKEESLKVLAEASDSGVKVLWLGDKLSNMRSFSLLKQTKGDHMWDAFHVKDPALQAWYYRSIAKLLSDLSDTDAWKEYNRLTEQVFEGVESKTESE